MSKCKLSLAAMIVLCSALSFAGRAETDPRDYIGISTLPSNTSIFLGYYRHVSSSDTTSLSQDLAIFRGVYLLKWGNLTIVPIDFLLPVADVTVYSPAAEGSPANFAIHSSGIGDLTYLPTAIYEIPESPGNSSIIGATVYFTAPVGSYDDTKPVNIGTHRWSVKPEIALGQRFMERFTFEMVGNITFYGDNSDLLVAPATKLTLSQNATPGLEVHFMADVTKVLEMGVSYYVFGYGKEFIQETNTPIPGGAQSTVSTVRGTVGIRIEQRNIIYLQYNQDLHASGGANAGANGSVSRFWGMRWVHAF
jgi:hypothetical protein